MNCMKAEIVKKSTNKNWPILLFNKSILKQRKLKEITSLLGEYDDLHCLDIGSDNGVISYLLRAKGGSWKSADLDRHAVASIQALVQKNAFQINDYSTPFQDDEFDRVVIVDFLEHIKSDKEFIYELFRIIKPGGEIIINVPYVKNSLLRRFRLFIGQTDEKHGHVRPGYTLEQLTPLLDDRFILTTSKTYSKFFSELIDTLVVFGLGLLKKEGKHTKKGLLVTEHDLKRHKNMLKLYSLIYPVFWIFAKLDSLLFWRSGYMLIAKAKTTKLSTQNQETTVATLSLN